MAVLKYKENGVWKNLSFVATQGDTVDLSGYATKDDIAAITPESIGAAEEEHSHTLDSLDAAPAVHNHLNQIEKYIPSNDDLDNYWYLCSVAISSNSTANTISNIPTTKAGRLWCFGSLAEQNDLTTGTWKYMTQVYLPYEGGTMFIRYAYTNGSGTLTVSSWYKFTGTAV